MLRRVVRVELKVFFSMCGFSVEAGFYSFIGVPGCHGVHKRAIFTGDRNSLLTQHCIKNNHNFDLDHVKIIDRCSQWSKRLFLEAWHSIRDPNAINEHMYKALGNPK